MFMWALVRWKSTGCHPADHGSSRQLTASSPSLLPSTHPLPLSVIHYHSNPTHVLAAERHELPWRLAFTTPSIEHSSNIRTNGGHSQPLDTSRQPRGCWKKGSRTISPSPDNFRTNYFIYEMLFCSGISLAYWRSTRHSVLIFPTVFIMWKTLDVSHDICEARMASCQI